MDFILIGRAPSVAHAPAARWNSSAARPPVVVVSLDYGRSAIVRSVHLVRAGKLARVVAVFFLLWTGVDLAVPSICAIDQDGTAQSDSTTFAIACTSSAPSSPATSGEDCFCCCQHVQHVTFWIAVFEATPVPAFASPLTTYFHVSESRLDHPPRLA